MLPPLAQRNRKRQPELTTSLPSLPLRVLDSVVRVLNLQPAVLMKTQE